MVLEAPGVLGFSILLGYIRQELYGLVYLEYQILRPFTCRTTTAKLPAVDDPNIAETLERLRLYGPLRRNISVRTLLPKNRVRTLPSRGRTPSSFSFGST